ncbi:MAG: MerR family transcriptional regulator, partial [Bradyrhizobium sp.]|uniref:MerR family transcriptional regulator n=1 Tax=Bradyrhizobium sp. TaxID=376 RepID=UPI001DF6BA9B
MSPSVRFLSPSEAANKLGVSAKALRLYEQRGLVVPQRSPAGWRAYGPEQMAEAAEIVALLRLGLSLAQIARARCGEPSELEPALAAHQATLEGQLRALAGTIGKVRTLRDELARGRPPATGELARLLQPTATPGVRFELPWPWGGEPFELSDIRPVTYIIGPLGSGKTRLALRLAETLPNATFLGLDRLADGGTAARARYEADPALKARVDRALSWLVDEGAMTSDALMALLVTLEADDAIVLVVDMVEQGLDQATQEALGAWLRRRAAAGGSPLFLLTRSSAILDLVAVGPNETILFCPANHSPPSRVAPYPGAAGYEAVATCLASPEVRARTAGVIAWRPS